MNSYGVIGDVHLGFKAYGSDKRTKEVLVAMEAALNLLRDEPIIFFPGDLFDETTMPNWVERDLFALKEKYKEQVWVIDGGNHDSTKTYSSVSVLDTFAEVKNVIVINSFEKEELTVCGLNILAVPHMKSQEDFLDCLDSLDGKWDVALLHCMVMSGLDLGPNDLNIDKDRLVRLASMCDRVWIGHQHKAEKPLPNVIIPGGVIEFNFGEVGEKYCYTRDKDFIIPQERRLVQLDLEWQGPTKLLALEFDKRHIYKLVIEDIPAEDFSTVKSTISLMQSQFDGVIVDKLTKFGHVELKVTEIKASFNLIEEFKSFVKLNELNLEVMLPILEDAIGEVTAEEDNQ